MPTLIILNPPVKNKFDPNKYERAVPETDKAFANIPLLARCIFNGARIVFSHWQAMETVYHII
jgi:hypothetical protein